MFVNGQDTTLLRDALISAAQILKPSEEIIDFKSIYLKDEKGAVEIVSQTVLRLSQDTKTAKTVSEWLENQTQLNRRMHATVFFMALRSTGITCSEASDYYASIAHNFPSLSWKYYLKLSVQCDWSEYFIECIKQFQPDIISYIVKRLYALSLECEDDVKYYTEHLALQSVIWSYFIMEDPSLLDATGLCPFSFPFASRDSAHETSTDTYEVIKGDNPARSRLLHIFVTILNRLLEASKSNIDGYYIRNVFQAFKTIFKLSSLVQVYDGGIANCLSMLNDVFEAAVDFCLQKDIQSEPVCFVLDHCYKNASWKINNGYLAFVMYQHWVDALVRKKLDEFQGLRSLLPSSVCFGKLSQFCLLDKKVFEDKDVVYCQFLKNMIVYDYPYAYRAAQLLLKHPEMWSTVELLDTLEKHVTVLNPEITHYQVADACVMADSKEKLRFLQLYFLMLSQGPREIYDETIRHSMMEYPYSDHFKLPEFDIQLTQFTRKTMLLEEAEKYLLPLFVQRPDTILATLIKQALMRGRDGLFLIQILKLVPSVCRFQKSIPFAKELTRYFLTEGPKEHEVKYLADLIKSVMEVHTEVEILPLSSFLGYCILPLLTQDGKIRLDLVLDCLNVALTVLLEKGKLTVKRKVLAVLANHVASLLNRFILCGDGKGKERGLLAFSCLSQVTDNKSSFELCPNSYEPILQVYILKLFGQQEYKDFVETLQEIDPVSWTLCCSNKDVSLFKDLLSKKKITYEELLGILIPLLTHYTKEEWFASSDLIKEYFNHPSTKSQHFPWLFPKSDPKLYAVIRCLMDCYYFIVLKGKCNLSYVTSCFTNTIMSVLDQEVHPHLLLNVFLDTSHLFSHLSAEETVSPLSSLLISLKKDVSLKCQGEIVHENYMKLTLLALKGLPDSDGKDSLLQKF